MKKVLPLLLILAVLAGCKSAEKLVSEGNYDAAIDKYIKKMVKGKADNEEKEYFDRAFRLANQRDEQRIEFLLSEGKTESWDEIYRLYQRLNMRQEKVQKVLPFDLNGRTIQYEYIDYTTRMVEAKSNAADYYYNRGKALMELDTKEDYRRAFTFFQRAANYRAEAYPDLDRLMADAKNMGMSRVLVEIDNPRNLRLPPEMFHEMLDVDLRRLNTAWVEYYAGDMHGDIGFDYFAVLVLEGADITQGETVEERYIREKTLEQREYLYDRRGNVRKDSLGNDMTRIITERISCTVYQFRKSRSATLFGHVEFIGAYPERLIHKEPVSATSVFECVYGHARGDRRALLPEDHELLEMRELPYPDDLSMLGDCSQIMQQAFTDVLRENKRLMP